MAAFTYQHPPPFHLDPLFLPNTPFYMSELILDEEQVDTNNIPTCCFPSSSSSTCVDHHHPLVPLDDQLHTEKYFTNTDSSSTIVDNFEGGSDQIISTQQEINPMEKKRKNRNGSSCFSSAQSKDVNKRAKSKKQKKCSVGSIQITEEVRNCKTDYKKKKNQKKGLVDEVENSPPTGYVHVRARRGEATDSHSLAERVRREKISERLKLLQSFVPGCDKVTSKAVMLDEIINYVQSLQLQVEFLSMKLASVNPIFYDFGVDLDAFVVKSEKPSNLASPMLLPCLQQSIPNTPTDLVDITTIPLPLPSTANNFSASLQQQQSPNDFSAQENGDHHQLWDVGNLQRPMFINQLGATNGVLFPLNPPHNN